MLARLDVLLGVVPGAAGVGHGDGEEGAGGDGADEQAAERLGAENRADHDGGDDGDEPGQNHLTEGARRADVDHALVVGGACPFHDAGDLAELAADLVDQRARGPAHRAHGEGGEERREQRADQRAHQDVGVPKVEDRDDAAASGLVDDRGVGGEEGEGGEDGRADGETLAGRGGCVAEGVEGVGAVADLFGKSGLLGDGAGVVGDGAVGIGREGDPQRREHADRGQRDAVQVGEPVGEPDADDDGDQRDEGAEHPQAEAVDDDGCGPGVGLVGQGLGPPVFVRGEPLRRGADDLPNDEADDDHPEEVEVEAEEADGEACPNEDEGAGAEDAGAEGL